MFSFSRLQPTGCGESPTLNIASTPNIMLKRQLNTMLLPRIIGQNLNIEWTPWRTVSKNGVDETLEISCRGLLELDTCSPSQCLPDNGTHESLLRCFCPSATRGSRAIIACPLPSQPNTQAQAFAPFTNTIHPDCKSGCRSSSGERDNKGE